MAHCFYNGITRERAAMCPKNKSPLVPQDCDYQGIIAGMRSNRKDLEAAGVFPGPFVELDGIFGVFKDCFVPRSAWYLLDKMNNKPGGWELSPVVRKSSLYKRYRKVHHPIFSLPIQVRSGGIGTSSSPSFWPGRGWTLMEVDGVGLFVGHDPAENPTVGFVRGHLIGTQTRQLLIEAPTLFEAINFFLHNFEGAAVGTRAKALALDPKPIPKHISVYPPCSRMFCSSRNELCCGYGKPEDVDPDFIGTCVLEDWEDPPPDCPYCNEYGDKANIPTIQLEAQDVS